MARPRQVTDEQIVAATRDAVHEHGPQASLDVVAERLGVTAPALIKRFGTRQNLVLTALAPDFAELDAIFDAPIDERSFEVQLESIIDRLSSYMAATLPRVMALRECGFSNEALMERVKVPMPVRASNGMHLWLKAARAEGLVSGDQLETAAMAIVGAVTTRTIAAHLTKQTWSARSQRKHGLELASLFARALAPRATPRRKRKS